MILVVFADYVIVYESVPVLPAVRRSVQLVTFRAGRPCWRVFVVLILVLTGLQQLYHLFYDGQDTVFVVLPDQPRYCWIRSCCLFANLVLIFLYEDLRRRSPAG